MRLTLALLKRKMPNGHIWFGKNRLGHHIYPDNIERMVKRLQVEERNMLLLRHPYLTVEQEYGHSGKQNHLINKQLEKAACRLSRSVKIEDKFNTLLQGDRWDV